MKRAILLIMCGALAACSQTAGTSGGPATTSATAKPATKAQPKKAQTVAQRCEDAMRKQNNAAMLGTALSVVGGFGGFGGRGGAVAAQAVSVGGSLVQAKAQGDADKALETECMG
ncbi:hypothetical protein [Hoeflea sp. 108]|uniref:hypothetical protein n=1 Tax=Hoeflea sp. 108 TaxID=1116369 RepID=UPI0012FC63F8|nr:hypothetical protein [Hoeflea sp. 108]